MNEFQGMGRYAGYLITAYGVTALVIIGNIVAARRRFRKIQQRLREQLARRAARPEAAGSAGELGSRGATAGRRS